MKNKWKIRGYKRVLSGMLTVITLMSTVLSPMVTYAAETGEEVKPPAYESVKDQLDEDEVVKAKDMELEFASAFDVKNDFKELKIKDTSKVKITLHEAKDDSGNDFSTEKAGTYKTEYYVEPVSGHPIYRISRNISVKEPQTEAATETKQTEANNSDQGSGDTESASDEDGESDTQVKVVADTESVETVENETETETVEAEELTTEQFDEMVEIAETQDTYDEESGLMLSDVMLQAEEADIDLMALEEGEEVSFEAVSLMAASTTTQSVDITRGSWYHYSDYGLGSYVTAPYYVKYGDVTATAYCVQPSKSGPGDGKYSITKLTDGKTLAKVCYYGTKASGDEGFFAEKYPDFSTGKRFIITHLAAAYANGSSDAFSGANAIAKSLAMELYDYCMSQPDIPDVDMAFSEDNVTAYVDGNGQRTKVVTFKADELQTITMKLPDGVKLHNETTGKTSASGADVELCGGTKFYLSAPLTQAKDVSASWSATMKGSITKDYSAYKITTGSGSQDLAFVFGEATGDEKYVFFKASWVELATVSIVKSDKSTSDKIAGAVYGLYSDKECKNLITKMPATDANGASSVTIPKTQDTVYLKEISVPTGFVIDTTAYNIKLVAFATTNQAVQDKEQLANLHIYKTGQVLTGAEVTESGVKFVYTDQKLSGAKYNVYAAEDIVTPTGRVAYKKGALVGENLTTGADGSVSINGLHLGKYTVTEVGAPANYYNAKESKSVTLSYAGQTVETVFSEMTFHNDRQKASVTVKKQDSETGNSLKGGIYGLYAASDIKDAKGKTIVTKGTLIEQVTTGADGTAAYKADLPIGYSYSIKENKAPEGYYRNSADVYTFAFNYTDDTKATVSFSHTFENDRVTAQINLFKKDKETGEPQGDAVLAGAVYGLYAKDDIVHPDGKTGVIYKAGTKVAELTMDEKGEAVIKDLYLGNYYVKELSASEGYLVDEKQYDLTCNYEGDLVATVVRETTSLEQVKKQPFQVIKAADNGKTDADLLEGAGFTAWLVSSLKTNADGSYDFSSAKPVVIGANGATEMFTDKTGHAVSVALPYGTYVVKETTTPHNYKPVDDFIVKITENKPNEPQVWRVMLDDEFRAKLKIVKKDDESHRTVLQPNTEFKVYNLDTKSYVEQVTTYPVVKTHKSYFTDADGYLILPNNLKIGNYRIEEVNAPYGYTLNQNYYNVQVDTNTMYQMDETSGDAIITVEYENHPVKGGLTIIKQGEVVTRYDGTFHYKMTELADAEFEVYAAEDIYTADFQKDEAGNRLLEYAKDELVTTVRTNSEGKAVAENLPLGKYYVKEKTAPTGFVLNTESQETEFVYADQNTPVIKETLTFTNDRQKVSVTTVKQDAENEAPVAGAFFGLYNKNDIVSGDQVIVKADTLLEKAESDSEGKAVFTQDLPLGQYYVKEEKAPAGYVSSDEVISYDASYQGQNVPVVTLREIKKNEPTTVEITKSDITTGVELDGASLSVLDKNGNVIDSWTSEKGKPHVIKRLTVGETYILREELAPYGYLKATDVEFTISDTAEVQKVEMKDEVPTGLLIINKKGEFLESVTLKDNAKGIVEHIFEYVSGNLSEVTFEVYAAEDIKAADGVSEDYFKKDELIGTITTDSTGIAKMGDLPVGKYYVKEVETAHGYVLDGEPRYVDLSYRDQDTPIVTYDEDWQNNRQRVSVNVFKKEKDTDRALAGGIFGIYAAEDILSASSKVLIEKDTLIEQKITDENGQITFIADLPIDCKYYVKEILAPDGFVNTDAQQEFTFEYAGADKEKAEYNFTFENEATTVEITKSDLTTGKELPGAKLQVTDKDGNVVDEWVSTEEAHVIKELVVGKKYTLTETKPADGYVTAESIEFVIENTAEVQKHEMKDDVTKVQISKTDITGEKEIPGAKLTILDENDQVVESWTSEAKTHYVEKLPIGKYTLREEQAPKGYVLSVDVSFEVKDTEEIQKVSMKNDTAKGKVIINKIDKDTEKPLMGVEFELRDSKGNVLETLKTDAAGHAESGLYEIASYKDGVYDKQEKYVLVETKTLEGYKLDSTEHEVVFEYADDQTPVIEVKFTLKNETVPVEETPDTPGTSITNAPKTGDDTNLWIPILMMIASLGGFAVMAGRKLRKKQK